MFKKQEDGGNFKEAETVIGPSLKVKGNFNGQGNIVVKGILDGNLKTGGNIFIGNKAKITANVEAKDISTGGEVDGNIIAKGYLEIKSTARILGDIECSSISIEKGALINGKITMSGSHQKEAEPKTADKK